MAIFNLYIFIFMYLCIYMLMYFIHLYADIGVFKLYLFRGFEIHLLLFIDSSLERWPLNYQLAVSKTLSVFYMHGFSARPASSLLYFCQQARNIVGVVNSVMPLACVSVGTVAFVGVSCLLAIPIIHTWIRVTWTYIVLQQKGLSLMVSTAVQLLVL